MLNRWAHAKSCISSTRDSHSWVRLNNKVWGMTPKTYHQVSAVKRWHAERIDLHEFALFESCHSNVTKHTAMIHGGIVPHSSHMMGDFFTDKSTQSTTLISATKKGYPMLSIENMYRCGPYSSGRLIKRRRIPLGCVFLLFPRRHDALFYSLYTIFWAERFMPYF